MLILVKFHKFNTRSLPLYLYLIYRLPEESEEIVKELIEELLSSLNIKLSQESTEMFIKDIIGGLMRSLTVTEIVEELIRNLQIEPDKSATEIIENTAEQLCVISEAEATQDEISSCFKEIMDDIVDEVLLIKEKPETVIANMVSRLVDNLPINFLKSQTSIDLLIGKLLNSNLDLKFAKTDIDGILLNIEVKDILNEILDKVFDTGIDLLYSICKK